MYADALAWARDYARRHRPGDESFLTECLSAAGEALAAAAGEMSPAEGRLAAFVRRRVLWRLCDVGRRESRRARRLAGPAALERMAAASRGGPEWAAREAVEAMSGAQRAVLKLVRVHGMSLAAAAGHLNMTEAEAARHLCAAEVRLEAAEALAIEEARRACE